MKREFLKELGLGGEQIEGIMAEHGRAVEKIKAEAGSRLCEIAVDRLVEDSGTVSPQVLKELLAGCSEKEAFAKISGLKSSCPWLFRRELPVFSAQCGHSDITSDPFRHGAGL